MDFDAVAAEWDATPIRVERARAAATAIKERLGARRPKRALEFGCGTGLLSFFLKDDIDEIVLLDSSEGMISEVAGKIKRQGVKNMRALCGSIEERLADIGRVDLAYALMVMHHIEDIDPVLASLRSTLLDGGLLCIVDLDKEDGSYHMAEGDFRGHNGFDQGELAAGLGIVGFRDIDSRIIFQNTKEIGGIERSFPIFCMSALRSSKMN